MIVRRCDLCEEEGAERYSLNASGTRSRGERNSAVGMGGLDICPACWHKHAEGVGSVPTFHFALRLWKRKPDGKYTSVGMGAITLCEECWRETAALNIRPGFEDKSFEVFARLMADA